MGIKQKIVRFVWIVYNHVFYNLGWKKPRQTSIKWAGSLYSGSICLAAYCFLSTVFSRNPYPQINMNKCLLGTIGRENIFECAFDDADGRAVVHGVWQTYWYSEDNSGRAGSVILYWISPVVYSYHLAHAFFLHVFVAMKPKGWIVTYFVIY